MPILTSNRSFTEDSKLKSSSNKNEVVNRSLKKIVKYGIETMVPDKSPSFIIVGAQKAGTTSLHHYLKQHPRLIGSRPKEVHYFDRDDNYAKGVKWYRQAFKDITQLLKKGLYFEATPEYLYRSFSARRIYEYDSNMKIIILLREPVKRAYSSWNMYRDFFERKGIPPRAQFGYINNKENNAYKELYQKGYFPTFEELVASELQKIDNNSGLEEPSLIRRSIYLPQIKRYHDFFGREQVLILGFKDLIQYKTETLNIVLNFLGMEKSSWDFIDNDEKKNVRSYPKKISQETKEKLDLFFEPYNKELFDYLGKKINW